MADKEVARYVDGVALHCYFDYMDSPKTLDLLHNKYPDIFIIYTECSIVPFLYVGNNISNSYNCSRNSSSNTINGDKIKNPIAFRNASFNIYRQY